VGIRPFEERDVEAVVGLHAKVFGTSGSSEDGLSPSAMAQYRAGAFDHPWTGAVTPLLYERDGAVGGFVAAIPRAMWFDGKEITAAVVSRFMVDPDERQASRIAVALLRRVLDGPQDLAYTNAANVAARHVWSATGGTTIPWLSTGWIRWLAPVSGRFADLAASRARAGPALAHAVRRVLAPADRLAMAVPGSAGTGAAAVPTAPTGGRRARPVEVSELLGWIDGCAQGRRLGPRYTEETLAWLLSYKRGLTNQGVLEATAVEDPDGEPLAWTVGFRSPSGRLQLLQFGTHGDDPTASLAAVVDHAAETGATSLRTRGQAGMFDAFVDTGWQPRVRDTFVAAARDPAIIEALLHGDAHLTGLEGEL
jgi:hypothetical protein